MAIELGRKNITDTEGFSDYAIGITLPIQKSNVYFNQSFTSLDQVKSNILHLMLTRKRERVMQPEFGSGLHELIFDFNDDSLADRIETTIEDAIALWLPYVTIDSIDVESTNAMKDLNTVSVNLKFTFEGSQELNSVTFTI